MKFFKCLTPQEEKIIFLRFVGHKPLNEIGIDLEITKERVRQIEAKALRKMRHYKNKNQVLIDLNSIEFIRPKDNEKLVCALF